MRTDELIKASVPIIKVAMNFMLGCDGIHAEHLQHIILNIRIKFAQAVRSKRNLSPS